MTPRTGCRVGLRSPDVPLKDRNIYDIDRLYFQITFNKNFNGNSDGSSDGEKHLILKDLLINKMTISYSRQANKKVRHH